MAGQENQQYTVLYGRLSQEDERAGESNSIQHQRTLLEKYAKEKGFENTIFLADDGYSGTNFERPSWKKIVEMIEAGQVANLIVKDASRLGREYLQVGYYMEIYFPQKNVRFIAVNDGVDSTVESSNDFNPIRNWANELHAKEKEIVTGVVQRINDNGDMTIDIGRTQAVLKADDNFKDKQFKCGDRIKVYVASVSNRERSGLSVKISRKSQELVKKLFEEEVTEIKDGTVEIMAIAREAGSRTKMAVRANVPHVDPVGACVGINGARVKNIVNELGNEQIDIVEWDDNPAQLIVNALSPAKVVSAVADEEEKKAKIIVSEQQLSLAIGKSGQNVRLAAKLTGYGIDIKSEADPEAFADMDKDNAEIVYGEDSEGYDDNQADNVMSLDEDYNEDAASDTEVVEE